MPALLFFRLRELVLHAVPASLKMAIASGIDSRSSPRLSVASASGLWRGTALPTTSGSAESAVAGSSGEVDALGAGVLLSRRVLRPLDSMRRSVRRMAAGEVDQPIPEPTDRDLAALAVDVNALGEALAATEQHRSRLESIFGSV